MDIISRQNIKSNIRRHLKTQNGRANHGMRNLPAAETQDFKSEDTVTVARGQITRKGSRTLEVSARPGDSNFACLLNLFCLVYSKRKYTLENCARLPF